MSRLESLTTLGRIGIQARSATLAILKLTSDPDARLRAASLTTLEQILAAPKEARQAAVKALEDDDVLVRCRAVVLLYRLAPNHPHIVPHVLELLKQPVGRTEMLSLVSRLGPWATRAVPTLIKLTSDANLPVRRQAIQTLHSMGAVARPAVPALLETLVDGHLDPASGGPRRSWLSAAIANRSCLLCWK